MSSGYHTCRRQHTLGTPKGFVTVAGDLIGMGITNLTVARVWWYLLNPISDFVSVVSDITSGVL